jgi:biopolymer transport protein ExbD
MKLGLSLLFSLLAVGAAVGQPTKTSSIQILRGGEIRLAGDSLGTVADLNPLKTRLAEIFQKGSRQVTVEAAKSSDFSDVLRVLRAIRDLGAKPLSLKLAGSEGDFMVMIPVSADEDEDMANLRPNPLTLVVRVAADDRIYLNGDLQKSRSALFARLRQIFHQRKKMKAYRPSSNEIEATLFLKPHPNLSLAAAIDLLSALHRVGANPLGLQIDDLGDGYSSPIDATEQSLAADGATECISSNLVPRGLDADPAPQSEGQR